jgi:hypothetical protein
MQFECVSGISVCDLGFKICRQIYDCDCFKWAPKSNVASISVPLDFVLNERLLDTDTTSDTQKLGDEGDLVGGLHFYTQLPYNNF